MILTGPQIIEEVGKGNIEIDPFVRDNINPASIDLSLGDEVAVYRMWTYRPEAYPLGSKPRDEDACKGQLYPHNERYIDVRKHKDFEVDTFKIGDRGIILKPGILYLMHTLERVRSYYSVPVLDGKSSLGRLGVVVHLTAGYGDPDFNGQYTLEVSVMHPVKVYPGMRFCQMRFHQILGEKLSYEESGHYIGEYAVGPVASRVYAQFQK